MSIRIESERLLLRELTESDLPAFVAIAGQEHITNFLPDWKDCAAWVQDWFKGVQWRYSIGDPNVEYILLAIIEKATGKLVGQVNTGCEFEKELPGELSIGYFVSGEAMNKGYATEAAKAIAQYYFLQNKNDFFCAVIKPSNAASIRVATKAGFRLVSEMTLPGKDPGEQVPFQYYRMYRTQTG